MICKNCQQQIHNNAVVCPHCGTKTYNDVESISMPTKKSKKSAAPIVLTFVGIGLIGALLITVGIGLFGALLAI